MTPPAGPVRLRTTGARFLAALVSLLVFTHAALAATFDIPAQPAPAALRQFIQQSGVEVLFSKDQLKNVTTSAVKGELEPEEALAKLLAGTGFSPKKSNGKNFTVEKNAAKPSTGSIKGSLTSDAGGPAAGVAVIIRETSQSTRTDRNGEFTFPEVDPGKYLLVAQGEGYQPMHIEGVRVQANRELTLGNEAMRRSDGIEKLDPFVVQAETVTQLEKFEVTDSKPKPFSDRNVDIPRGIDDVQPYYVFDAKAIEQSGSANIEDFLKKRLTMNAVAQTNSQGVGLNNYFGSGVIGGNTSSINLRGLGPDSTLVLVNGRRMAGVTISAGQARQPDINGLPLAAIDRIEVLPSSASGIYGGSAVGGVVNIILKRDYQGGDLRLAYDSTWDGHAPTKSFSATYGFGFEGGKSHLMLSASYSESEPLRVGARAQLIERGYATLLKNNPSYLGIDPTPGAFNLPLLGATPNIVGYDLDTGMPTNLTLKSTGASLNSPLATLPAGYSATSNPSTIIGGRWNLAFPDVNNPPTGLRTPLGSNPKTEWVGGTFSRQMTDKIEFFVDASYSVNKSFQDANVTSLQPNNNTMAYVLVQADSPVNPFNQAVIVTFPENQTVPFSTKSAVFSVTAGFKADLPFNWKGELDYTLSQSRWDGNNYGIDDLDAWADINAGVLNPFVDTIAHPLDLTKYLSPFHYGAASRIDDIALRASGPLMQWSWGEPTLTVGIEHRREHQPESSSLQVWSLQPASTLMQTFFAKTQTANSVYLEGTIPLVTEKNALPGIRLFELQATDRIEKYTVNTGSASMDSHPGATPPFYVIRPTPPDAAANRRGGTQQYGSADYSSNNQTFGFKYRPLNDVLLRASLGTAFLPPQYNQLYPNPRVTVNGDQITDPTTGTTYRVNTLTGGNPDLKPQHSKNWNLGLIFDPRSGPLRGVRIDLEYYRISQFGFITAPTGDQVLSDPGLSGRVTRSTTTGLITQIDETLLNATEFRTEGLDLSVDYAFRTPAGTFDLRGAATKILHNNQQLTIDSPVYDYAGAPPAYGGQAKWKGNFSASWAYQQWTASWNTTWYGSYAVAGSAAGEQIGRGIDQGLLAAQGSDHIPSQVYHDIFLSYAFDPQSEVGSRSSWVYSVLHGLKVELGINNVFNTTPAYEAYNMPFYVSPFGDLRLRTFRISVVKQF